MGRKHKHYPDASITCVEENGEPVIYIVFDGRRIARRRHPDSPQARSWVSLDPEWRVSDGPDGVRSRQLLIERVSVLMQ